MTIKFQEKEMKMRVFHNESGTMTPMIIVKILKGLDEIELFVCHPNLPPLSILVDGHSSWFGMPFINYISNQDEEGNELIGKSHHWNAYIGLQNCTALWQVGDSSKQNGNFKNGLRIAANRITQHQRINRKPLKLLKRDIIPMIMEAYLKSTNRMAIAKHGWNPMNFNTLLDVTIVHGNKGTHQYPSEDDLDLEVDVAGAAVNDNGSGIIGRSINDVELQKRKSRSEWQFINRPRVVDSFTVSEGKTFEVIEMIRSSKRRNVAGERTLQKARAETIDKSSQAVKQADISKRITAGTEALRGNLSLRDATLKGKL